jgi:hypothetical protein
MSSPAMAASHTSIPPRREPVHGRTKFTIYYRHHYEMIIRFIYLFDDDDYNITDIISPREVYISLLFILTTRH